MAQRLSLTQQIAQLDTPAPPDFNAEEFTTAEHGDNDDDVQGLNGGRDHYLNVGMSALRRLQDGVQDSKYEGVRMSRKQLLEQYSFSDEGVEDEGSDDERSIEDGEDEHDEPASSEDELGDQDEDPAQPEEKRNTTTDKYTNHDATKPPRETEGITSTLRKTREEDRKKGLAVSRQIDIWDGLLDARIRFQKASVAANRLPIHQWSTFRESSEVQESLLRMLQEATLLSEDIFELQDLISKDTDPSPPRKRRRIEGSETVSDYETQLEDASKSLSTSENAYHPHLVQTLNKWSSKIQAVAPSVLLPANRNAFSKDHNQIKSAVQLVDENLSDHAKLLSRTHLWRGKGTRLVTPATTEEKHDDLFDDTDFYQQLLRDVIDARNGTGTNDWMLVQKERKAKKKVDTKASKGRKLRYEVHEKLRNFMVPITVRRTWHEEQIDELFSSVLGKGFESGLKSHETCTSELDSDKIQGFRLFG
ncbi:TRAUB-domain-containing protein [Marasmius fiardii PR-910]|nr:TRAUB-domain-containing protein [Marasmius fiardii PR-910]